MKQDRITQRIIDSVDFQLELDRKFREDPSKSGEIRLLTIEESKNMPVHMVAVTAEEELLLRNFPQTERANIFHMWRMLGSGQSFANFLRDIIEERRKANESLNRKCS